MQAMCTSCLRAALLTIFSCFSDSGVKVDYTQQWSSRGWQGRRPGKKGKSKYSPNQLEPDLLPLLVPLLDPGAGTHSSEVLLKELARLVLLTLRSRFQLNFPKKLELRSTADLKFLAAVEVDIILPAVPCLVLIGEYNWGGENFEFKIEAP